MTDNNCFICWNPLTKEYGKKSIVHKYDKENKSSEKWQHSCHEKCLNNWSKQCISVGNGVYPKCPICNDFKIPINKIPKSLRKRAIEILEEEEEDQEDEVQVQEEDEIQEEEDYEVIVARQRLDILDHYHRHNENMPFLGILICCKGYPIIRASNISFNLRINGTLGELKAALLTRNMAFYKSKGIFNFDNLAHNLNLHNWINWTYPSYRISDVHYGIPPYTSRFQPLDSAFNLNINENLTFAEMYLEYQIKAGTIINAEPNLINSEQKPESYKKLKDIYLKKNLYYHGPTGPDDPGYYERAYDNDENPLFSDRYLYENGRFTNKATDASLMWLMVHIDSI